VMGSAEKEAARGNEHGKPGIMLGSGREVVSL
jgi:hypothetical protein